MDDRVLSKDQLPELLRFLIQNKQELSQGKDIYDFILSSCKPTDDLFLPALQQLIKYNPTLDCFKLFKLIFQKDYFLVISHLLPLCPVQSNIQDYCRFLATSAGEPLFMKAWGLCLQYFGASLHRTIHLNELLQLAEAQFNSTLPECRLKAFQCWKYLIANFSLRDHLKHTKRFNLILVPIFNSLNHERNVQVLDECTLTFSYLCARVSTMDIAIWDSLIRPSLDTRQTLHYRSISRLLAPIAKSESLVEDWYEVIDKPIEEILSLTKSCYGYEKWNDEQFELICKIHKNVSDHAFANSLSSYAFKEWKSKNSGPTDILLAALDPEKKLEMWKKLVLNANQEWLDKEPNFDELMRWTIDCLRKSALDPKFASIIGIFCDLEIPDRDFTDADHKFIAFLHKSIESLTGLVPHPSAAYSKLKAFHSKLTHLPAGKISPKIHKFEQVLHSKSPLGSPASKPKPASTFKRQKTEYVVIPPKPDASSPTKTPHQLVSCTDIRRDRIQLRS